MRKFIDIVEGRLIAELFQHQAVTWDIKTQSEWIASYQIDSETSVRVRIDTDYMFNCFDPDAYDEEADEYPETFVWHVNLDYLQTKRDRSHGWARGTTKEATQVFSWVIALCRDFIRLNNPDVLWMGAMNSDMSRRKLYAAIMKRAAAEMHSAGYESEIMEEEDSVLYLVKKPHLVCESSRPSGLLLKEGDHTPAMYDPDDDDHYDALKKTGFFGAQAAGCLPMARTTGRVLIVHRSDAVEQPRTWGNVGGAYHASERPVEAAQRELHEETGYAGPVQMIPLYVFQKGSFRYSNFLALVEDEFVPELGWEATDYKWVELGDWPQPLHFGLQALFADAPSMKTIQHYSSLKSQE